MKLAEKKCSIKSQTASINNPVEMVFFARAMLNFNLLRSVRTSHMKMVRDSWLD